MEYTNEQIIADYKEIVDLYIESFKLMVTETRNVLIELKNAKKCNEEVERVYKELIEKYKRVVAEQESLIVLIKYLKKLIEPVINSCYDVAKFYHTDLRKQSDKIKNNLVPVIVDRYTEIILLGLNIISNNCEYAKREIGIEMLYKSQEMYNTMKNNLIESKKLYEEAKKLKEKYCQ